MEADWFEQYQLHFAAEDGDMERVQHLVNAGEPLERFDELGFTPLHYAVKAENLDLVRYLLACGANINSHDEPHIGETPLGAVAGTCSYAMAKFLLEQGANPTIPGWVGLTALHRVKRRHPSEEQAAILALMEIAASRFCADPL